MPGDTVDLSMSQQKMIPKTRGDLSCLLASNTLRPPYLSATAPAFISSLSMSLVETLGWGDEEVDQTTSQRGQLGSGSDVIRVFPHLVCCEAPPPRLRLHLQKALPLYLPPTKL